MRLIMRYDWCVPYQASGVGTIPFEYESKEKAIKDFIDAIEEAFIDEKDDFIFLGKEFSVRDFTYENGEIFMPGFYSLEEWFEKYKIGETK